MNLGELAGMKDITVNAVGTEFGGASPQSVAFAQNMCTKVGAAYCAEQQMDIAGPSKRGPSR